MIEGLLFAIAIVGTHLAAELLPSALWPTLGHACLWGVLTGTGLWLAWRSVVAGLGPLLSFLLLVGIAASHTWVCLEAFPGGGSAAAWFWAWASLFGIATVVAYIQGLCLGLASERSVASIQPTRWSLRSLMAIVTVLAILASLPHHLPLTLARLGWGLVFFAPNLGLALWLHRHWRREMVSGSGYRMMEGVLVLLLAMMTLGLWSASPSERMALFGGLGIQAFTMGLLRVAECFPASLRSSPTVVAAASVTSTKEAIVPRSQSTILRLHARLDEL